MHAHNVDNKLMNAFYSIKLLSHIDTVVPSTVKQITKNVWNDIVYCAKIPVKNARRMRIMPFP